MMYLAPTTGDTTKLHR